MEHKEYIVGTQIRYIGCCTKCKGKTGKVVEIRKRTCTITLPQSSCGVFDYDGTMACEWGHIEPLRLVGEQLQFAFME